MKPLSGKFELTGNSLVRRSQLLPAIIPVSKATFRRMLLAGEFPPPRNLRERIPVWKGSIVIAWLNEEDPKATNEAV